MTDYCISSYSCHRQWCKSKSFFEHWTELIIIIDTSANILIDYFQDITSQIYYLRGANMYDCARSSITFNNLNLTSYDVHSRQARDQMLVNLYTLQQSFIKVNNKITEKTEQQNKRIQQLRDRIIACKNKIQEIEGVNKAIRFVSPAEYPIRYKFDPQKNLSLFRQYMERTTINKFDLNAHYQMKHDLEEVGEASKLQINNLYQFIFFLYGKLKCKKMTILEKGVSVSSTKSENLGKIPASIRYVDSLTVFDTYINPYKKYQIAEKPRPKQKNVSKAPAQPVIDPGVSLSDYRVKAYDPENPYYQPKQNDAPQIEFNQDIDDLTGIVDIDLDDFLGGVTTVSTSNPIPKNYVADPYKEQVPRQNTSDTTFNSQPFSSSPANTLPPPPPPPSSLNMTLPPPPPGNLLPPPPPPPSLNMTLPPPPPGNLPPPPPVPNLSLSTPPPPPPPPPLLNPSPTFSAPPASSGDGNRSQLLKELNNPNPMARLKKTITKQFSPLDHLKPKDQQSQQQNTNDNPNLPPRTMSHMQALILKIQARKKALKPERQEVIEHEESD